LTERPTSMGSTNTVLGGLTSTTAIGSMRVVGIGVVGVGTGVGAGKANDSVMGTRSLVEKNAA